jgi:hypothetical protein
MQYNKKVHGSEEKITAKCTLRLLPLRVLSKSFVSQIYDANIPPTSWGCGLNQMSLFSKSRHPNSQKGKQYDVAQM